MDSTKYFLLIPICIEWTHTSIHLCIEWTIHSWPRGSTSERRWLEDSASRWGRNNVKRSRLTFVPSSRDWHTFCLCGALLSSFSCFAGPSSLLGAASATLGEYQWGGLYLPLLHMGFNPCKFPTIKWPYVIYWLGGVSVKYHVFLVRSITRPALLVRTAWTRSKTPGYHAEWWRSTYPYSQGLSSLDLSALHDQVYFLVPEALL